MIYSMRIANNKHSFLGICVVFAVNLLAGGAFAQVSTLLPIMVQSSQTQNGITVTVAVQKNAVAGEPVIMRVRVTNHGTHPILCDRDAQYPRYDITAKDYQDFKYDVKKIGFGSYNFNQDPRRKSLHTALAVIAPGKSSLAVINLTRCFDLSEEAEIQITVTVPYQEVLATPFTAPGAIQQHFITAPPVVFVLGSPPDDSTFGRNQQSFGDPYP